MAIVLPIQGLRFTSEAEWDYSKIITPPYDVITANGRGAFTIKARIMLYDWNIQDPFRMIIINENKYTTSSRSF